MAKKQLNINLSQSFLKTVENKVIELRRLLMFQYIHSRTLTFQKNCVICFIESPLKMMKNAIYFFLNALFVLKIFKVLSWCHHFLVMQKKRLDYIVKINYKIHDVPTWLVNSWNRNIAQYRPEVKATRQWILVN